MPRALRCFYLDVRADLQIGGVFGRHLDENGPVGALVDRHGWLPTLCSADMTLQRMDNVLIVVDDLGAAKAFFAELGMELDGETSVEGEWVDRVIGLDGVRADIAMMRTPDGQRLS